MRRLLVAAAVVLLAGCGASGYGRDVKGFTQQAKAPAEQAVLRSIATYRTTKDEARACSLVTPSFISGRFGGTLDNCEQVQREAPRYLPDEADVQSVEGDAARVQIDEPTATRSIYEMRRIGGVWKVDDIVEP